MIKNAINPLIMSFCKYGSRTMLLLLFMTVFQSCYHYTITSKKGPSTETQSQVVHNFFWGLIVKPKNGLNPKNCAPDSVEAMGFHMVTATNNFGYSLLTVVTLGIWSPMKVEWQCAKPCPEEGVIE